MPDDPAAEAAEHTARFLQRHSRAFLLSTRADGSPTGHPMTGRWRDGAMYFTTYRKSAKVANMRRDPRVSCVVTSNAGEEPFRAVLIAGEIEDLGSGPEALALFHGALGEAEPPASPVGHVPSSMNSHVQQRSEEQKRVILRVVARHVEDLGEC